MHISPYNKYTIFVWESFLVAVTTREQKKSYDDSTLSGKNCGLGNFPGIWSTVYIVSLNSPKKLMKSFQKRAGCTEREWTLDYVVLPVHFYQFDLVMRLHTLHWAEDWRSTIYNCVFIEMIMLFDACLCNYYKNL